MGNGRADVYRASGAGVDRMTDEQKREYAEAIKAALGMEYGPPMEGEEGWASPVLAKDWLASRRMRTFACIPDALPDEDDGWDVLYGVAEEERQEQERKLAEERAKASAPKPPEGPWAVVGKREDDGDR